MRLKEWYGWHFPVLAKIETDNYKFAKLARAIQDKSGLGEGSLKELEDITEAFSVGWN